MDHISRTWSFKLHISHQTFCSKTYRCCRFTTTVW